MNSIAESSPSSNPHLAGIAEAIRRAVDTELGAEAPFSERESAALALTNQATRTFLEDDLQGISDGFTDKLFVDEDLHRKHHDGAGKYFSLCGPLQVDRATYRRVGKRNPPAVVPLELKAGLIENCTPAMAFSLAQGVAKQDIRSYIEDLDAAHRIPPSRSKAESASKAIGSAAKVAAPRIVLCLRRSEETPEEAVAISIGIDRVNVPKEELRPEGAPPKTRRKPRKKPRVRVAPLPVDVNWRLAYVGTFSLVDADGDVLVTRKYSESASIGPERLVAGLMGDIRNALKQRPDLLLGVVQDGAPELWGLLRNALDEEPLVLHWKEAIDWYHLLEHLGEALKVAFPDPTQRSEILDEWSARLARDDGAIDVIEDWLSFAYVDISEKDREQFEAVLTYIENNKDRMRYRSLLKNNLLIGSGVTEGAAKSVIAIRTRGRGQRWKDEGLEAVLALREQYCSDRLIPFWAHLSARFQARVACAA